MRLACWQAAVRRENGERRLERLAEVAARARRAGADLLVTPELSLTGYHASPAEVARAAEGVDRLAEQAGRIAARAGIALLFGLPERSGSVTYNTVRLVDEHGAAVAAYRKAHLFGAGERAAFAAGDHGVVQADLGGLTVGLLVCYDVEFPELVRAHALRGTDLLLVPSALARPWELVAETLVPARAFESQLYIAYVNWAGSDALGVYCGLTRVAGPDGSVRSAPASGAELLVADVRQDVLDSARAATPYLADRRPELYSDLTAGARHVRS
ncbi:carbon-nitrogen hydrolase family protein [Phytohabitans houttuyneae]|uniref:Nitrilase n=1 Tax=Phytohabitans houttuyneae TaxID=1076126 RepID=A0A6V8KNA5_9ACTN|nr:carbon-nitrogen hydrolase family protein [Phytohabitans houttuyneae]GFJ85374.1 nitrilase [Phytohabitans houttuyneae]